MCGKCPGIHFIFPFLIWFCLLQRIKIEEIRKDPWFQKNYIPVKRTEESEVDLDDVRAVFEDIEVSYHIFINILFHNLLYFGTVESKKSMHSFVGL